MSKCTVSKDKLKALYEVWTGQSAMLTEMDAGQDLYGPQYMVLVHRWVNVGKGKRTVKRSEYLFASLEIAEACKKYWQARGGIEKLAVLKFEYDYGYVEDPFPAIYA